MCSISLFVRVSLVLAKSSMSNMNVSSQAELAKKAEMEAFQRAGEAYLANIQKSRAVRPTQYSTGPLI